MFLEPKVRQLLIDSCHSSQEADQYLFENLSLPKFIALLVKIAVDDDDYQGDAPMASAYYLSKANPKLLQIYEEKLLALLEMADGYAGSIAIALSKFKSVRAKIIIEQRLAEKWFPEHQYLEALSYYKTC